MNKIGCFVGCALALAASPALACDFFADNGARLKIIPGGALIVSTDGDTLACETSSGGTGVALRVLHCDQSTSAMFYVSTTPGGAEYTILIAGNEAWYKDCDAEPLEIETAQDLPPAATLTPNQASFQICDPDFVSQARREDVTPYIQASRATVCYDGYTPMHVAVSSGNLDAIELLFQAGFALDRRNDFGSTPLHVAILASDLEAVKKLVALGADLHAWGPDGVTPYQFALDWNEGAISDYLFMQGAQ